MAVCLLRSDLRVCLTCLGLSGVWFGLAFLGFAVVVVFSCFVLFYLFCYVLFWLVGFVVVIVCLFLHFYLLAFMCMDVFCLNTCLSVHCLCSVHTGTRREIQISSVWELHYVEC